MNMYSKKTRKVVSTVIIAFLILAMLISVVAAAF